jgi:murein DD-endopeptidase MepM/ murein hydrolase activator NlpD
VKRSTITSFLVASGTVIFLSAASTPQKPKPGYPLVSGSITQGYGVPWSEDTTKLHTGLDISAKKDTQVFAMKSGVVKNRGWLGKSNTGIDWGYYLVVRNDDGSFSGYLHIKIQKSYADNARIEAGDTIGTVFRDHLHVNDCRQIAGCEYAAFPNPTFTEKFGSFGKFYLKPRLSF